MGYIVQDRVEISIYFNDVEYPLDAGNILNFLHIGVSNKFRLPTLHMELIDSTYGLSQTVLVDDATPITVAIRALGNNLTNTYKFRLFTHKKEHSGSGYTWSIDAYLDHPLYWAGTAMSVLRGSTNEVLQRIASLCGLKYEGIQTADTQTWPTQNMLYSKFVKHIVQRGFVNETSFMSSAVDLDSVLRYVNVNAPSEVKYQLLAKDYREGTLPVVDYRGSSSSGFSNQTTGYNSAYTRQSTTDAAVHTSVDKLAFTPNVKRPEFNMDVKKLAQRGTQRYGPIDVGNTSLEMDRALYQNRRYSNLFTQTMDFMINVPTPVNIFDSINFTAEMDNGATNVADNGVYRVTDRAILVQGMNYAEKIRGMRHGVNNG